MPAELSPLATATPSPKQAVSITAPTWIKDHRTWPLITLYLSTGYGLVQLPWKLDISDIFGVQSGFHYSASFAANPPDVDGDNNFNGLDFTKGRNRFTAPPFVCP
jgi:hypothetical protein